MAFSLQMTPKIIHLSLLSPYFLQDLWIPNVFIYNLKSFQNVAVLKKLAGVWIIGGKKIFYNQVETVKFNLVFENCEY